MNVRVRLFAAARDAVGQSLVECELPDDATIGRLREALLKQHPALVRLLPYCTFAVGADYAADSAAIPPTAEVACIPPVSGG